MTTEQDYSGVKNIIFDLGGVFLNIDFAITESAFKELGVNGFQNMFTQHHANDLFIQLETGAITELEFYDAFRASSGVLLSNEQIKTAWNALLLDFRLPTLAWLETIKGKYRIFLFSNTNQIHHNAFHASYQEQTGRDNFDGFFIKAYYSQHMGMRKPDIAPFQHILLEQGLEASETLFIDDTIKNVLAAREAGMLSHHLVWPQTLPELGL
jgi:putative hydrolase of the HAD superfamily